MPDDGFLDLTEAERRQAAGLPPVDRPSGRTASQHPPAAPPPDPRQAAAAGNATRYLCAAAHLDKGFRDGALRWVLDQEHHAVAPSSSIDIVPILRHCLAARQRELQRDAAVTAAVLVCLLIAFWPVLTLLAFLYSAACALRALRHLGERHAVGVVVQGFVALVLFAIGTLAAGRATAEMAGIGSAVLRGNGTAIGDLVRLLLIPLLALAGTIAAGAWYRLSVHRFVVQTLTPRTFSPQAAPPAPLRARARLDYLADAQDGNVTMYGRAARGAPFVGCGRMKQSWSLAIPLVPDADRTAAGRPEVDGTDAASIPPLTRESLYRHMRHALLSLASPDARPEDRIQGLRLQDRIFVSGLLPADHPLIGRDGSPRSRVSAEELRHLAGAERNRAAHYLTLRISGWEGELDVTVLLYFSIRGQMLYFEFLGFSLPPIHAAYQAIDSFEHVTGRVTARAVWRSVRHCPSLLARAPVDLLSPMVDAIRREFETRSELRDMNRRLAFDFGAVASVREFGADWRSPDLFHDLEDKRYLDVVERRAVDAVIEVMEKSGFNTDEFRARASINIDNSMTIGSIDAANSAVAIGTSTASLRNQRDGGATRAAAAHPGPNSPVPTGGGARTGGGLS